MAELAKDDIIPFEGGENEVSLVEDGVQDEFGNELYPEQSDDRGSFSEEEEETEENADDDREKEAPEEKAGED